MRRANWFEKLTAKIEGEFDYRLERIILNLTEDICQRMETLKMNRTQLANKLDVTPAAVTKILNGNSNFTLRTLLTLSDALDADLRIEFSAKTANTVTATSNFRIYYLNESYLESAVGYFEARYLPQKNQPILSAYADAGSQQHLAASAA